MASTLAWLDYSEEHQRRARDLIGMFTQKESRDELGLGLIRDSLSEMISPGISVTQTRALYFLMVPWLFKVGRKRGKSGSSLVAWVEYKERVLVEVLRAGGDLTGLIGRQAGVRVKQVPSTIYWNGLQRLGILRVNGSKTEVASSGDRSLRENLEAVSETVSRETTVWHHNLPDVPEGFPDLPHMNFSLVASNAVWLRERIAEGANNTALGWLAGQSVTPNPTADGPWEEPALRRAPPGIKEVVVHAELFSLVMNGAALLYNQLLSEAAQKLKLPSGSSSNFEARLDDWTKTMNSHQTRFQNWDLKDFWAAVDSKYPVSWATRGFVTSWIEMALDYPEIAIGEKGKSLIAARERFQKRALARLDNERLLRQWGGESGSGRMSFRWPQVRRILTDISTA